MGRLFPGAVAGSLCVLLGTSSAFADELVLTYDDDQPDGYRSFGGFGHAVRFMAPADRQWYVSRIDVCASQYGGGHDPANTFVRAYVCDGNMNAIGEGQAPYQLFRYGRAQDWGSIDMPLVPVKGPFVVIVAPGSLQTRGLYVAYDTTWKDAGDIHSAVGSPGKPARPVDQLLDWMIRCTITDEEEALAPPEDTGEVLSWDDGSAEDQQSFGGGTGMVVRFDPPAGERLLDAVRLYGSAYGTGRDGDRRAFTVAVCDADMKVLSTSMYPHTLFTSDAHWVRVDLDPDVPVKGPFYIVYVGHCTRTEGIYLGVDTSGHSSLGKPGELAEWSFRLPQNQVNWMIRAELKKP